MNDFSKKILNQIEKEAIEPTPKLIFHLRNTGLWFLATVSVVLGGFATSLLAYNAANQDWDIYSHLGESFLGSIISAIPYLWVITLIIFLVLAVLNIEHSKKGYKYSPILVLVVSFGITLVLGLLGFVSGFGAKADNYLGQKFTPYQTVESKKLEIWNQPEKGLLAGTIESLTGNTLALRSFDGKIWQIDFKNATIRGRADLRSGQEIKVIGQDNGSVITASEIRPWGNAFDGGASGNGNQGQAGSGAMHRNGRDR